jgi:hypothetical protein
MIWRFPSQLQWQDWHGKLLMPFMPVKLTPAKKFFAKLCFGEHDPFA